MKYKDSDCGLFPYIREDIYGLSPNDPEFYGWEIKKFDIDKKWEKSSGENVKVAVIDTGIDFNHSDLKDNILEGKNFIELSEDPIDRNGHGTHVAGTIAAKKNGKGMVGIAPNTKIIPVKALDNNGRGNIDNIVKAVIWSANRGVDFITMSLGSPLHKIELEKAISYANTKGAIVFCAAGNSGELIEIMYPARYNNVISIGAIDENFDRTSFTCSGDSLDFLAPGHNILSCVPNNAYASMSGTSMSNPFAVGCASLALSLYQKQGKAHQLRNINNYIDLFSKNAIPLNSSKYRNNKKYEGYGIIQPI